jgi:fatty acid desaturase
MEIDINKELEEATRHFKKNIPKELLKLTSINLLLKDTIVDYLIIILSILIYPHAIIWIKILLIIIIVSRLHSLGVIIHDLTHLPIKKKNYKVIIIEVLAAYPVGTTINAMRYHHLRHHKDSGMLEDPYFHHFKSFNKNHFIIKILRILVGFILIPSWILRSFIGGFCLLDTRLRILYARIFMEHKGEINNKDLDEIEQCCKEDIKQIIYLTILFFSIIKIAGLSLFFQLYIIPILLTGIVSYYRLLKEHTYTRVYNRELNTIIKTTNDHNTNSVFKFLLAPRNIGYHVAHHLHPQVGYRGLKKIRNFYLKFNKEIYNG